MPQKEKYWKNPEKYRLKVKVWKQTHREKWKEQKRRYYKQNREEILRRRRNLKERKLTLIKELYGEVCRLCNDKPERIEYHEINGNKHEVSLHMYGFQFIREHVNDFVPLCNPCHRMVHGLMRFNLKWDDILKLIENLPHKRGINLL